MAGGAPLHAASPTSSEPCPLASLGSGPAGRPDHVLPYLPSPPCLPAAGEHPHPGAHTCTHILGLPCCHCTGQSPSRSTSPHPLQDISSAILSSLLRDFALLTPSLFPLLYKCAGILGFFSPLFRKFHSWLHFCLQALPLFSCPHFPPPVLSLN